MRHRNTLNQDTPQGPIDRVRACLQSRSTDTINRSLRRMVAVLIILGLQLSACSLTPENAAYNGVVSQAAKIEPIKGTNLNRVILTADAVKRLDIQTTQVRDMRIGGTQRLVVPYAAILYDLHGQVWVYTNPAPLTFVRASVIVDHIDGDQAILWKGPPSGTKIVTVGVPELFGTEFEGGLQPS